MKFIKILTASWLMTLSVMSAFASEPISTVQNGATSVEYEVTRDNWFVNVAAGPQVLFSDHDKQASLGKRISPALDISLGKWFKSGIGLRLMYSGLTAKGATQDGTYSTGESLGGADKGWTSVQKFSFCNIHADIMFNLVQCFNKENLNRMWSCSPYLGVGIAHVYDSPKKNCASFNMGFYNTIRIIECLDATIDLRGVLVGDGFDGEKGRRKGEGMLSLSLGLAYNF